MPNHADIDGKPATGSWFTEFSEPFAAFRKAGVDITVVSPKGGPASVDPRGYPSRDEIAGVRDALATLNATGHLASVSPADFDGVFFPGGHGPVFDLAVDPAIKTLIAAFWEAGKANDQVDAEAWIAGEPYNAHGGFKVVTVRPWSQVIPEAEPGLLARIRDEEKAKRGT